MAAVWAGAVSVSLLAAGPALAQNGASGPVAQSGVLPKSNITLRVRCAWT
jgi:hypothetical protein